MIKPEFKKIQLDNMDIITLTSNGEVSTETEKVTEPRTKLTDNNLGLGD